jgi:hypothetical protein
VENRFDLDGGGRQRKLPTKPELLWLIKKYKNKNDLMSEEKKSSGPSAGGPSKKKYGHHKKRHGNKSPIVRPAKFHGWKEELGGNYFDCTGYGQSDRFMKTVQKIADNVGQEYKGGGIIRT